MMGPLRVEHRAGLSFDAPRVSDRVTGNDVLQDVGARLLDTSSDPILDRARAVSTALSSYDHALVMGRAARPGDNDIYGTSRELRHSRVRARQTP